MNTNFQGKKVPKENASCKCLSLIMLDSIVKAKKKYYPQTLLDECKYEKRLKWRVLLMINLNQVHLMMKVIVTLMVKPAISLTMSLAMRLIMNNLLKVKTIF